MAPQTFAPPPEFDLPSGRLELRERHLVAEIAAGRSARPRVATGRIAFAPMLVVAAVLVLLLVAPWQSRGPSIVDRALAAVGSGPVVHAVVEYSWPQDVVVDLATGAERERVHRAEYWYDEQRKQLRARFATDGGEPADYAGPAVGELDPVLTGFASQYREALESGRAHVVGDTTVDGRPAKRLEFAPRGSGAVQEVAVDAETFAPLRFHETYRGGRRSPEWRIVSIESVPRDPSDFVAAEPSRPRPSVGEVSEAREITLVDAARALRARPLWLGSSFAGRALDSVELSQTTAWLTDGSKVSGVLVRLVYGPVRVSLAHDAAGGYALGFGDVEYPTPPEGSVAVTGSDREGWTGELRRGDLSVMLSAPRKERLLAAARALAPQR